MIRFYPDEFDVKYFSEYLIINYHHCDAFENIYMCVCVLGTNAKAEFDM